MTAVSLEFFPPKNAEAEAALWRAVERLAVLAPNFVSVTYGAGGSTRARTHACVRRLVQETSLPVAAHLTCVGAPKSEIDDVIDDYAAVGVRHIVALRGDMPDMQAFVPHAQGYDGAVALVAAIKQRHDANGDNFEISVSAYPEKHPDSASLAADIELLKRKIDAGATRAITQFAFDMDIYLRFRDSLVQAGVEIPVIPAIMPTTNFAGVQRMAAKCGTAVPAWLIEKFDGLQDDIKERKRVAEAIAIEQCQALVAAGFPHIHFYTLNQADVTYGVCDALKLGGKP